MKRLIVLCATIFAIALAQAQDAHADEASFINGVSSHGTPVAPVTLTLGHMVCAEVSENGTAGLDSLMQTAYAAGMTSHDTAVIIVTAVYELCPSNKPALHAWLGTEGT